MAKNKNVNKGEGLPNEQSGPIVTEPVVPEQSSEESGAVPGDVVEPQQEQAPAVEATAEQKPQEEIPAQDEAPLSEESFAGIADALNQQVESPVQPINQFWIGQKIETRSGVGIIVDYEKFVKYAFGLTILHNPGLAVAFVGQAGKSKLMGVLGITDRAEQDAKWAEFKELYNKR